MFCLKIKLRQLTESSDFTIKLHNSTTSEKGGLWSLLLFFFCFTPASLFLKIGYFVCFDMYVKVVRTSEELWGRYPVMTRFLLKN